MPVNLVGREFDVSKFRSLRFLPLAKRFLPLAVHTLPDLGQLRGVGRWGLLLLLLPTWCWTLDIVVLEDLGTVGVLVGERFRLVARLQVAFHTSRGDYMRVARHNVLILLQLLSKLIFLFRRTGCDYETTVTSIWDSRLLMMLVN
jgi:hypothetical protein